MSADRTAAVVAGMLYILGMIAGLLSVAPSVDSRDYLLKAAANEEQVLRAALWQFVMAAAYVGIAITLYPVLKRHGEALALGFVGFRLIAGAFILIGTILLLLLLTLSQDFVKDTFPDVSYFQTLGTLLRTGRDLVNHVGMILALSFGGLLYYSLLFQAELVPRWLSGWGLAGVVLAIVASVLVMVRRIGVVTPTYVALTAPIALQELVLAMWLVITGFNPVALQATS